MDLEKLEQLWSILNREHVQPRELSGILELAQQHNLTLTVDDVQVIAKRMERDAGEVIWPPSVVKFILEYVSDRKINSILDPWAGLGTLLLPLVGATGATEACGIYHYKTPVKYLDSENAVSWLWGMPLEELDKVTGTFDLVASCPPWGLRRETVSFTSHTITDNRGHLILLKSCLRLSDNGVGLFVVYPNFVAASRGRGVYANLGRFDLGLVAYIAIPPGVFTPLMRIPTALAIISKGESEHIFVGELAENPDRNRVLLNNLRANKEGREIGLGKIVEKNKFKGYEVLIAEDRVARMASRMGLVPTPLRKVVTEINLVKASESPGFDEKANTVYLPLIGRSNAVTSLSEFTLKPHNYAQLLINADGASAHYLAGFFNSPLGHATRASACSGVTTPKITKALLADIQLFLPDRKTQTETVGADSMVHNLMSELKELRGKIWSRPREVKRTIKEIGKVNREERFANWIDNLPFPLASILWTYHAASGDDRRQYEHLDHFFEALAEFMAIILLSGFSNVPELFAEEKLILRRTLSENNLSVEKSSFGTWVKIAERLAKKARTMLNKEKEGRIRCEQMFRTSDADILQAVFSKEIVGVLQATNNLRNDWRGHGGVIGDRTAHERHITLQNYLTGVRKCFGNVWERYQLIQLRSMKFVEGSYNITADRVMGARHPFESIELHTSEPLEDGQLHLVGQEERVALKLLPLVKVMPSPRTAENACYFYNRKEDGDLRFISYHFEAEAVVKKVFSDTAEALKLILEDDDSRTGKIDVR